MVASFRVQCPACKGFYKCSIDKGMIVRKGDSSVMLSIRLPQCHHVLLVYIDANMNPRSVQLLQDPRIKVEYIRCDHDNLLLREKELLDLHAAAIDLKDQSRMEDTWQELKRVRKEIIQTGLD